MRVLVVAAHPDDEVLGCGATVARHSAEGDEVHSLILAEGSTSRAPSRQAAADSDELAHLQACARAAASVLGAASVRFGGLPDNRMDHLDLLDVVKLVEATVDELQPTAVYTHHGGDLNVDHQITHRAVLTATRPVPGRSVQRLYTFETVSSTEWGERLDPFVPQRFVDVSSTRIVALYIPRRRKVRRRPSTSARKADAPLHISQGERVE